MKTNEPMKPPERFQKIIDVVNDRDREWFLTHPGVSWYSRRYVPGEVWPYFPDCNEVMVAEIAPGIRVRHPMERTTV